jgi:hypothetical protein
MALSAAMPITWSPILVYLGITLILGLLDWPGLARAVRSKLLALREEDFCAAAKLMGARPSRIIGRHLLPNFMSHLIASATLSIPAMILGETALSFLGLGLRPPITSWGVLLTESQNIEAVALYPWLLTPMIPGDGHRPRLQLPRRWPARRGRSVRVRPRPVRSKATERDEGLLLLILLRGHSASDVWSEERPFSSQRLDSNAPTGRTRRPTTVRHTFAARREAT